jgi:hypothetical protein
MSPNQYEIDPYPHLQASQDWSVQVRVWPDGL